jgi:hypothetical protein
MRRKRWADRRDPIPRNGYLPLLSPRLLAHLKKQDTVEKLDKELRRLEWCLAICICPKRMMPYIYCDEMAEIMSELLILREIPHQTVVGNCSEGSSHVWVRIGDKDWDPTDQGCSEEFDICMTFDGKAQHKGLGPVIEVRQTETLKRLLEEIQ